MPSAATAPRHVLAFILLFAFALRLAAALILPDQSAALVDAVGYREAALDLWSTLSFKSLYIMPLYPAMIALTGSGWPQTLADIALSVVSVWLVHEIAREMFDDAAAAILAALAAACYPALVFFAVVGLSETLFTALVLASFLMWYRGAFFAAAVFAVLSILTRAYVELLAPILVVYFTLVVHRLGARAVIRNLCVYALVYCALMAPWWLHNYALHDRFIRLTLGAGAHLYAGNNPLNTSGGAIGGEDYDVTRFENADPVARDRALKAAAGAYISEDLGRFARMAVVKLGRTWRPWPRNEAYASPANIAISVVSYLPVLMLSLFYLAPGDGASGASPCRWCCLPHIRA